MNSINNNFYPVIKLSDGRIIYRELELSPAERIIRFEKNLEAEENQARVFARHYEGRLSLPVLSVLNCIISRKWRTSPVIVTAYKTKYVEALHETNISIFDFLNSFYEGLYPVFVEGGLSE